MLNSGLVVGLPHLNDYLSLEECIVVLNVSGIVLRERQAENKQREVTGHYRSEEMVLNSTEFPWKIFTRGSFWGSLFFDLHP